MRFFGVRLVRGFSSATLRGFERDKYYRGSAVLTVRFSSLLDAGNDNDDGCLREVTRRMVPDPTTVNIDGGGGCTFVRQ